MSDADRKRPFLATGRVVEGKPADWKAHEEASKHVMRPAGVDEGGEPHDEEVNWRAAFYADPGVTVCPACEQHHWWEGTVLECAWCGAHFTTAHPRTIVKPPTRSF